MQLSFCRGMLVVLASVMPALAVAQSDDRTLEQRLQRVEDELAIRSVLADTSTRQEARDYKGYAALFAMSGEWVDGNGVHKGRDAIYELLAGLYATPAGRDSIENFDVTSIAEVRVNGNKATTRSRHLFVRARPQGELSQVLASRYEDEFIREGGKWKILRRVEYPSVPSREQIGLVRERQDTCTAAPQAANLVATGGPNLSRLNDGEAVFEIAFGDSRNGVLVGKDGLAARTADGGRTWMRVSIGSGKLFTVVYAQSRRAIIAGSGNMYCSDGRGGNWSPIERDTAGVILHLAFKGQTGVAVGRNGMVLWSRDGGATWKEQRSGVSFNLLSVAVADDNTAVAVGPHGDFLHTTDGGRSWQSLRPDPEHSYDLNAVWMVNQTLGFAVDDGGAIFKTSDGGAHWEKAASPVKNVALKGIAFGDSRHGVIVGAKGTALVTEDGGQTWKARPTDTTNTLAAVAFADPLTAVIGGAAGTILRSTDGGLTWSEAGIQQ